MKVLIVNPDTQEVKAEFSNQYALNRGDTITEAHTVSTLTLTPRIYLVILQAKTSQMPDLKTLASATFEVKPAIEITKTIPDVKNILVWLNYPWQSGQNIPDRALIEQALDEAGVSYHIVLDKKDFETELRNPYYTDFMILGDHNPIEDHFSEELREQVYSGKGLISSMFNRQNLDADMFGIKFNGYLSGRDYPIELLEGEVAQAGTFQSYGRALKVEVFNSVDNIAWVVETTNKNTIKYPGIIKGEYGKGKVLFYAFDLGLSTSNYSQFASLLKNSLTYIHSEIPRSAQNDIFGAYQLIPVEIKIKSLGGAFDLRITETYSSEIKIYDPETGQWITENLWVINTHLNPDEAKTILYYALTPNIAGIFTLQTEVGYMENGTYNFYQNINIDIVIDSNAQTLAGDIITALNTLQVSGQEKAKVDNAIIYIQNVRDRIVITERDIEQNIHDILKAVDSLFDVISVDISEVRLMMDVFLIMWEARLYTDEI